MKYIYYLIIAVTTVLFSACDAHQIEPDDSIPYQADILCTDGKTYSFEKCQKLNKKPIAVVFSTSSLSDEGSSGYAVYLWDLPPAQFADSLNVKQNTSADIYAYDGNMNTAHMLDGKVVTSPIAESVLSVWEYHQSAFIPSVAEMKLLRAAAPVVNENIRKCGGDTIPTNAEECWYWTSTEVKNQENIKAWLFSTGSGAFQETKKDVSHKVRPIISLRY